MAHTTMALADPSQPKRRQFLTGSAKSGVAFTALSLAATGATGLGMTGLAQAVASSSAAPDLLMSLGARIAIEVQSQLGSADSGYSVHFLDAAGPSCDGLRQGLRHAFSAHGLQLEVASAERNHSLGLVTIRNLDTGRSARVELFPEALSQVDLIEHSFADSRQRDHAIMTAPRDSLFSLS
jgi:hypothetical protein